MRPRGDSFRSARQHFLLLVFGLALAKDHGVVGVKPDAAGLVMPGSAGEQWRRANNTPDVPCPLVHGGLVCLCRELGAVIRLDAKTGKEYCSERIHSARYRASPVYAEGKICLTSRDGYVTVINAGQQFERLAENKMSDQIGASPAIANGRIYLCGWEALYAIEASK